ncbi:MAG TPA: biopolymer transporter ExbD [Verrucomicrobia bacterium]|nr:biopolymer transporter ExbD [Verrucomicrobiales bacterium]HIL55589.1 biopolymer transporter ExbD [Verrucomicrobiota bacterium]
MAKNFQRCRKKLSSGSGEINISPLIDVVFILLIFFIVTTVFVDETGVEIEKPRAASQQELDKNSILIGITAEGGVYHGGREIGVGGVRAVVGRLLKGDDLPVVIQADRRTATQKTVEVLDEAKLAGAVRVFVSTLNGS